MPSPGQALDTYTKSACPFTSVLAALHGRPYDNCQEWGRLVEKRLLSSPPDVIVTTSSAYMVLDNGKPLPADQAEVAMIDGVRKLWQPLIKAGSQIVVMPSTPMLPFDPAECVDQHRDHMTECTAPRSEALKGNGARVQKAADYPGVGIVDINKAICPTKQCAPVIGGVLVYRDRVHITATYAATLAEDLRAAFRPYLHTVDSQASENDQNDKRR